jgi:hypothetical protein
MQMSEARARDAWGRTSSLMAMISSAAGVACEPSDFDPFAQKPVMMVSMDQFMSAGASLAKAKHAKQDPRTAH